jgi:flagellar motor protein MotB
MILIFAIPGAGSAREPLTDHPLISAYEGSVMRRKDVKQFDQYDAFTGMDESGKTPTGISLEGKVTKLIYAKLEDRSVLEVFRNYEDAVRQAGAETLYTCNQDKQECVARYAGTTFQKYADIHSMSNLAGRYLLAKIEEAEQTAYIAIAVGPNSSTIHVIEVKKMDTGMVSLDAAALGKGIDARGYVVVEGIYFDTDKATLKTQSTTALAEMAKLLVARPDLSVYVVGHTDMQGSFTHNQGLSENRAKAVVEALVVDHDIDRDRMEGHGVGPLSPQANNNSDSGRAKNRRVVLVAR